METDAQQPARLGSMSADEMAAVSGSHELSVAHRSSSAITAASWVPHRSSTLSSFVVSQWSAWRFPSEAGKLPQYVHKKFRMKAFTLLAIQSCSMLGIMILVHHVISYSAMTPGDSQMAFILLGVVTLIPMMVLRSRENTYPMNYGLMVIITLLSGAWWGFFSSTTFGAALEAWGIEYIHFQLFACICGTLSAAAFLAFLQRPVTREHRRCAAVMPLLLGWAISAIAEFLVCAQLGMHPTSSLLALLLALLLVILLILEVSGLLAECNPDCFMRVVLAMDSKLLVVITLPLFFIASCLEYTPPIDEEQRVPEAATQ